MHPQYVAPRSSSKSCSVADASQARTSGSLSYLFHTDSCSFPQGYTQVTYPQKAGDGRRDAGRSRVKNRDRRLLCPRASRAFSQYPCWPSWQHAVAQTTQVTSKNLWSLTQFQSQSSRHLPVSTTKVVQGQAFAPVPPRAVPAGGCA